MSRKFKKGDKVVCISDKYDSSLITLGKTYIVQKDEYKYGDLRVIDLFAKTRIQPFYANQFRHMRKKKLMIKDIL